MSLTSLPDIPLWALLADREIGPFWTQLAERNDPVVSVQGPPQSGKTAFLFAHLYHHLFRKGAFQDAILVASSEHHAQHIQSMLLHWLSPLLKKAFRVEIALEGSDRDAYGFRGAEEMILSLRDRNREVRYQTRPEGLYAHMPRQGMIKIIHPKSANAGGSYRDMPFYGRDILSATLDLCGIRGSYYGASDRFNNGEERGFAVYLCHTSRHYRVPQEWARVTTGDKHIHGRLVSAVMVGRSPDIKIGWDASSPEEKEYRFPFDVWVGGHLRELYFVENTPRIRRNRNWKILKDFADKHPALYPRRKDLESLVGALPAVKPDWEKDLVP